MTRKAGRYDIEIPQGAYYSLTLACKDDSGALVDTAGWTARMQVRASVDDAVPLISLTTENGRLATGIQSSTVGGVTYQWNLLVTILDTDTSGLANWGDGRYDIELVDTFGHVLRVLEGVAVLSPEVTR